MLHSHHPCMTRTYETLNDRRVDYFWRSAPLLMAVPVLYVLRGWLRTTVLPKATSAVVLDEVVGTEQEQDRFIRSWLPLMPPASLQTRGCGLDWATGFRTTI